MVICKQGVLIYQTKGKSKMPAMMRGKAMTRRHMGRTRTAMQGRQRTVTTKAAKTTGTNSP